MATNWREYQEEAAEFFRSLGLDAETDVSVQGVRTNHDIDVLVKSQHAGFEVTWAVECKYWSEPVSKLHVLALREIVHEIGADRGILLAENGFQSGAIEAANLTNVQVTSLAQARQFASEQVIAMQLRELHDRIDSCKAQYWEIPKRRRIECGLRPGVGEPGFSGAAVIDSVEDLMRNAFRGVYPITPDWRAKITAQDWPEQFDSAAEVVSAVVPLVVELERRLAECSPQV